MTIRRPLYSALGVEPSASNAEVRRAYRKKAKAAHPDVGGDPEEFHILSTAVAILTDPDRRARYDETGDMQGGASKPESIDQRALQIIAAAFEAVLQSDKDMETSNVVELMVGAISGGRHQGRIDIANVTNRIARLRKALNRFSGKGRVPAQMEQIIERSIEKFTAELRSIEDRLKPLDLALEMLSAVEYRTDYAMPHELYGIAGMMGAARPYRFTPT